MTEKQIPDLYIGGQWFTGKGEALVSTNPVTQDVIWKGHGANKAQVNAAVDKAREAFKQWRNTSIESRIEFMRQYAQGLKDAQDELAQTIASETGKPLWESKTEAAAMIGKVEISIKAYQERTGVTESDTPQGKSVLRHRPHGVVAVFGPFNFPGHLPNGHIVPALLAGNTVVFKPSEQTPGVASLMFHIFQKLKFPDGVINMVQGAVSTGQDLASHPGIDGLFFTGSSRTGKTLHEQYGGQPEKILALEMGGNNPLIIQSDADVSAAVHHTIQSAFISAGQRCTCARRLMVPEGSWGDGFLNSLVEAVSKIKVGHFDDDPQPFMGSVINPDTAQKILRTWKELVQMDGQVLHEMTLLKPGTALLSPGIIDLTGIKNIADEETFGPLLTVYRYRDFQEAIDLANNTRYGLSAGLIGNSPEHYQQFLQQIRAGIVNWNRPITGASSGSPFGGIGASGNHRASAYYAADYCAYPVASIEQKQATVPDTLSPGLNL